MTTDEIKQRFVEEIKLRAWGDQYIDQKEEFTILQLAIQQGMSVASSSLLLLEVCQVHDFVLESAILSHVGKALEVFVENDGMLSEQEFSDAVSLCRKEAKNRRSEKQCRRLVVHLIQDQGWKCRQGWFNNWFDRIRADLAR